MCLQLRQDEGTDHPHLQGTFTAGGRPYRRRSAAPRLARVETPSYFRRRHRLAVGVFKRGRRANFRLANARSDQIRDQRPGRNTGIGSAIEIGRLFVSLCSYRR